MNKYVLGFCYNDGLTFAPRGRYVLLVDKAAPDWQRGKLNGVGGKVEADETYRMAMVREFKEETGVKVVGEDWDATVALCGPDWTIQCYRTFQPIETLNTAVRLMWNTREPIVKHNTLGACERGVNHLRWMIQYNMVHDPTERVVSPLIMREPV